MSGLDFAASFGPTVLAPQPSSSPAPRPGKRKHRKAYTTSLPSKRPSTPNPFDAPASSAHHHHPPLTIAVHADAFPGLHVGDGGASVSHVSKNGVSFFPHCSINYEGKEGDGEEGEESVGGGTGEGEEEKSRLSSTEMEDDISIRWTTPTMASNHIVRPLPSPSSLSVPQPSIGSGINSSEHSIVHSTITAPSTHSYRAKSLTSSSASAGGFHFPPVFSPKAGNADAMYSDTDASASPLSGHPQQQHSASAASPPSATSPLSHGLQPPPPPFRPHETPAALSGHARATSHPGVSGVYHPPTTTIQSPPPPSTNHLTLNTNAVALASQLFDDSELAGASTGPPSAAERYDVQRQRSPRSAIQQQRSTTSSLRAPSSYASSTTHSPQSASASDAIAPPAALHRLSSQPLATDSMHPSALHTSNHSLSLSRIGASAPRSPAARGQGRKARGEGEDEEGEEAMDDEDSTSANKSREESRARGVGVVRT